jgi:hypothetical protein
VWIYPQGASYRKVSTAYLAELVVGEECRGKLKEHQKLGQGKTMAKWDVPLTTTLASNKFPQLYGLYMTSIAITKGRLLTLIFKKWSAEEAHVPSNATRRTYLIFNET